MRELPEIASDELVLAAADDRAEGPVDGHQAAALVADHHPRRRGPEHLAEHVPPGPLDLAHDSVLRLGGVTVVREQANHAIRLVLGV